MGTAPTLRRRMIVSLGLMVLGTLAIGGGAIVAVNGLHQDLGVATRGYRQLRQLIGVGFLASKARESLTANPPRPADASAALHAAMSILNPREDPDAVDTESTAWTDESARRDCAKLISAAMTDRSPTALNPLFAKLSRVSDDVRKTIADAQSAADRKRHLTLESIASLCVAVVLAAVAIGVVQYRNVVGPVRRIGRGVRAFSNGDFDQRVAISGDQEFATLAGDFNRMADELSALYRDLEQKVRIKSQELVRAEQLASLGYLAAGVAHEINNPLGVIAGYGERAIQQLSAGLNEQTLPKTKKALAVICDEAFRCKQITDRLLSLARPGSSQKQVISIATIAEQVISNLAGLGSPGQRSLSLHTDSSADLSILASVGELKQVILNLMINAIEAVDAMTGRVEVRVHRRGDQIELSVADNGQGMTAETVDRVFEPFFSQKRGERAGTGLGLSIAHAIVTDHGGQIRAQSGGPGRGSTITIQLPAADTGGKRCKRMTIQTWRRRLRRAPRCVFSSSRTNRGCVNCSSMSCRTWDLSRPPPGRPKMPCD